MTHGYGFPFSAPRIGGTRSERIATGVFAILLMSTTSIALFFILNRKIQQHRQWMTRSYAVALVFFEVRVIGEYIDHAHLLIDQGVGPVHSAARESPPR